MNYKYNDNELLYLFSEGVEEAEEILFKKYVGLINKRISSFKIQSRDKDDFFQEGMMMLVIAIKTYSDRYNKTFNKYFDLILQRRFIKLLKKDANYFYKVTLVDDYTSLPLLNEPWEYEYENEINISTGLFSDFEKEVFEALKKGLKPKKIAQNLKSDVKSIYNCIYRLKNKI